MTPNDDPMVPAIHVEAQARYVLGFPILIAVELRNRTTDTDYLDLPRLGLLTPIDSLAVELRPQRGGTAVSLGPSFEMADRELLRTELMAGERARMLIDVSTFGQPLKAGRYELVGRLFSGPGSFRESEPVEVELVAPTAAERAEAERLRAQGMDRKRLDTGSWQPFLTSNRSAVAAPANLGATASQQLAPYLALHRAAYGPIPLAQIPLEAFAAFKGPVLAPEGALLRYELIAARGSPPEIAAARADLLRQWPAMKQRVEQVDRGSGLLTTLRKVYGVERTSPPRAGKPPAG